MIMNRLALLLALLLALGACSSVDADGLIDGAGSTSADPGPEPAEDAVPDPAIEANAPLLAAALTELVTNDHTFGPGPPPFTEYLLQSRLDPGAGGTGAGGSDRDLSDAERAAIEDAIAPFGPIRWIHDVEAFQTENRVPSIEGSAILGVGEPIVDGDRALVGVSLWCGDVCGTWLTYEIDLIDGVWEVTGINGPVAIS